MAIRRAALERVGPFDPAVEGGGDEQEWQERRQAADPSACALYVAAACVEHRRSPDDSRLRRLCAASYRRGREARRFDAASGRSRPGTDGAGRAGAMSRTRRPAALPRGSDDGRPQRRATALGARGAPLGAGRRDSRAAPGQGPAQEDFLSGASGTVGGSTRCAGDLARLLDGASPLGQAPAPGRAAAAEPQRRRVQVLCIARPQHAAAVTAIRAELAASRHEVEMLTAPPGGRGKFENLNLLLAKHPAAGHDWLFVIDDDVRFAPRLSRPLPVPGGAFLADAGTARAPARLARRLGGHPPPAGSAVRETAFVEIGPVTAFAAEAFAELLPFPELRMGWGLDLHWAAIARRKGWRCGVVDAVPIGHRLSPAGAGYGHEQAIAEARLFLAERPYLSASEAERTLTTHGSW